MNDNNNPTTSSAPGQAPATLSAGPTSPPDGLPSLSGSAFAAPIPSATSQIPAVHTNLPTPSTPFPSAISSTSLAPTQTSSQPQTSIVASDFLASNLCGNPSPGDVDLICAFLGINYDEIPTNRFSRVKLSCFSIYFRRAYRRVYGYAFLFFFIILVIFISHERIMAEISLPLIGIFICLVCGSLSYELCPRVVKRKVAKIKAVNPNASHEELKSICAARSGKSALAVITVAVVPFVLFAIVICLSVGVFNSFFQYATEESEPSMQAPSSPSLSSTVRWH